MTHPVRALLQSALDGGAHLLGEALELSPSTRGLRAAWPDRVHLLPAADAALVGVGVGIALSGAQAIVELADPSALPAALGQLVEAQALHRSDQPLRLLLRVPFGPDPVAFAPELLLQAVPGLHLGCPSSPAEAPRLLGEALAAGAPVVLLEPRAALVGPPGEAPGPGGLGRAALLRSGDACSLLTWGPDLQACLAAAELLAEEGLSVDLVDLRWLSPVDTALLGARVGHTGRAVLVGPLAAPLLGVLQAAFLRLESPPVQVAPADGQAVRVAEIVAAVRAALSY